MEIIKESMIEDIDDEIRNSFHKKNKSKEFPIKIKERLNKAIMGNNLDVFREIMDNNYKFIDINKPIDKYQKYSAIHYAALYGYFELMKDLIDKYKANINLISNDKWSALHLSSYKGFIEIVILLFKFSTSFSWDAFLSWGL